MFIWKKTFNTLQQLVADQENDIGALKKDLNDLTHEVEDKTSEIEKLRSLLKKQYEDTEKYKKECVRLKEVVFKCAAVMAPYMEEEAKK